MKICTMQIFYDIYVAATMDVRSKSISDLCTDNSDCYLAVVEVGVHSFFLKQEILKLILCSCV